MLNLSQNIHKLLLLFCLLIFSACTNESSSENNASGPQFASPKIKTAFTEVMAIHDEVMPFISDMKRSKRELLSLKETASIQAKQVQQIDETVNLLSKGDSLMFAWMENFKMPEPDTPEEKALPYLASEKVKISLVSETMKDGINKSKILLGQFETE